MSDEQKENISIESETPSPSEPIKELIGESQNRSDIEPKPEEIEADLDEHSGSTNSGGEEDHDESVVPLEPGQTPLEESKGSIRDDFELLNPVLSYDRFFPGRILGNTFTLKNVTNKV